jgi:hypothetical protein
MLVKVASTNGPSRQFRPTNVLSDGCTGTGWGVPSRANFCFDGEVLRSPSTLHTLICRVPILHIVSYNG